jgi:hypothetical protein
MKKFVKWINLTYYSFGNGGSGGSMYDGKNQRVFRGVLCD